MFGPLYTSGTRIYLGRRRARWDKIFNPPWILTQSRIFARARDL